MNTKTHMQLNGRIPRRLVEKTKMFALENETTISEVMTHSLSQFLSSKEKREQMPAVKIEAHKTPTIEKGIPIPANPKRGDKYGFMAEMEIGDSVLLDESAKNSVHNAANRAKITIVMRSVEGGIRIWRTK